MDTIGRQVTAFVSLFMATGLIILMYMIFEPQRRTAMADQQLERSVERGARLFAVNCVVCHGPTGGGIAGAGFPLNTEDNIEPDDDRRAYLRTVLYRGRSNSNGTLPNMPVFLNTEGGSLHNEHIDDIINFIGYGNWEEVPQILANELGTPVAAIPTPPNLGTPDPGQGGRGGAAGAPRPGSAGAAPDAPPGAQIFSANCTRCHRISPEFPNGQAVGPNLTGIAIRGKIPSLRPIVPTQVETNQEGLTRWIRNPGAIRPGSAMPAFGEDQISNEQMTQLVEWLLTHNTPPRR